MKNFSKISLGLALTGALVGSALAQAPKAATASTNTPATAAKSATPLAPAKSIFTQPATAQNGHDPFFPESTRPFESVVASTHSVEATTLSVKGFSIVRGRPMVIINNHSFMVGDEGDVIATGGRAHVRCLEIRTSTVVIEINGARHEIHY